MKIVATVVWFYCKALLRIEEQVNPGPRPVRCNGCSNLFTGPGDDRGEGSLVMDATVNHRTAIAAKVG